MKTLITGAYGLLGNRVVGHFAQNPAYKITGLVRKEVLENNIEGVKYVSVDLTDTNALNKLLKSLRPDLIIHCAANVNLADCEINRKYTFDLHVSATKTLSASFGLKKFIYISTDSVFDGKVGDYYENSFTNPLNYYAKTKLAGEKVALEQFKQTVVMRTNIYGLNYQLKNSLAEWALKNLTAGNEINGFKDVIFNPVSTHQLSNAIKKIAETPYTGIINIGSDSYISKFQFLSMLALESGENIELVKPSKSESMHSTLQRPLNTTLNTTNFENCFGTIYSINEGIKVLIDEFKIIRE